MVNENAEKDRDTGPENIRHNFRLGDITWVKYSGSSWWPAQVIDESCVGSKPKKKDKYDCLVRLYGTCQYLYVDPWKSKSEFEMMLKQENKSAMEAFREVLEKELSGISLCRDGYEEEAVNSKGGDTKGASKKNSSRKARKQEGLKQQYNEQEDQNVGSNATTGNSRKRKGGRARQSSSTNDVIDKDHSDSSAEGLRNKRQHETPADHTEIKAMVRDILFKDIIDKEHDAEMAYVDEVINGICNTTDSVIGGGGDASTKGGLGFKQSGSGVEGESSNVTQKRKDEATEDAFQVMSPKTMKGNTPSRRTKAMTPEQLRARHNRQNRIMQTLALIPPSGSPFGRNEEVAASRQKF